MLNKVDVPEARELAEFVRGDIEALGYRVFEVSAVAHNGLRELTFALGQLIEEHRAAAPVEEAPERIVIRPKGSERDFEIRVEGGTYGKVYRILGDKPVRWMQQTDFQNEEAVGYLGDRLEKLGVENELYRLGAVAGSTVTIGTGRRQRRVRLGTDDLVGSGTDTLAARNRHPLQRRRSAPDDEGASRGVPPTDGCAFHRARRRGAAETVEPRANGSRGTRRESRG